MKNVLIIPAVLLSIGSMFVTSCNNSSADKAMKSPTTNTADSASGKENAEKNEKEGSENIDKNSIAKPVSMVEGADTKSKTNENLQAAYKGETTASAKYAAYSTKAEQEGYHEIAMLFKAASMSENIHAKNHKAVLQESGISTPVITPEFRVSSTKENLDDAIKGETYEVTTMYPEFLTVANAANDQMALISMTYAYKTEKKHKLMYENALVALQNNTVKSLPSVYFICPTCGNTYETKAPARCGISMTSGEKFFKVNSL